MASSQMELQPLRRSTKDTIGDVEPVHKALEFAMVASLTSGAHTAALHLCNTTKTYQKLSHHSSGLYLSTLPGTARKKH